MSTWKLGKCTGSAAGLCMSAHSTMTCHRGRGHEETHLGRYVITWCLVQVSDSPAPEMALMNKRKKSSESLSLPYENRPANHSQETITSNMHIACIMDTYYHYIISCLLCRGHSHIHILHQQRTYLAHHLMHATTFTKAVTSPLSFSLHLFTQTQCSQCVPLILHQPI